MNKEKIRLIIPLFIVLFFLIYTWYDIFFAGYVAVLQHFVAILFFVIVVYLFFTHIKKAVIATALFLTAGTFNLLTLTPAVKSYWYGIKIFSFEMMTPAFQLESFAILILFFLLNFDALVNIYLDFKERKRDDKK